jgi:hypothetical protein
MTQDYSIKINKRDGALEIAGPSQEWVDAKLAELNGIYTTPLEPGGEGAQDSRRGPAAPRPRSRRGEAPRDKGAKAAPEETGSAPRRARRSGGRPQRNAELEARLPRDLLEKFSTYIEARKAAWDKKQTNQMAIIATFLEDEIGWTGIDEHDAYTVYRALGIEGPTNYRSTLQNAYGRDRFFSGMDDGKYSLSMPGEKFGRSGSLDK